MLAGSIYRTSRELPGLSDRARAEIEMAVADTLAVMAAGWDEPAARGPRNACPAIRLPWETDNGGDPESRALVWGMAAHALDYDDVHMTSVTHPSAVLVTAIEAMVRARPKLAHRRAGAFALGLAVNVALGEALGFRHYEHGWHATSTIGSVAAGAAIAHLLDLDEPAFISALAIAAAQASGLQRNFGTMVKPLQAGLAASAGVRAGLLAAAGVCGPEDVFGGANGFLAAFGGDAAAMPELNVESAVTTLSRKLFACCYMAHRPVAAALELRQSLNPAALDDRALTVSVTVPPGCLKALTVSIPTTGLEAKFSGRYTVAHALRHGTLGLGAFMDAAVADSAVIDLARRVELSESAADSSDLVGMDRGEVTMSASLDGKIVVSATATTYPGSPAQPMTTEQLAEKLSDCVGGDVAIANGIMRGAKDFAMSR